MYLSHSALFVLFIHFVTAQETIWYNPMNETLPSWSGTISYTVSTSQCPGGKAYCYHLASEGYIEHTAATNNPPYQRVFLSYSLSASWLRSNKKDECSIQYSVDNGASWNVIEETIADTDVSNTYSFTNPSADNVAALKIRLERIGINHGCYYNEFILTGTRITSSPTNQPTIPPTKKATNEPTISTTGRSTLSPSDAPTAHPVTSAPTMKPTAMPSKYPTNVASLSPSMLPTMTPTVMPTLSSTTTPSKHPSNLPSLSPIMLSTSSPTKSPTTPPTSAHVGSSTSPSTSPLTNGPTSALSAAPTTTDAVTSRPTRSPQAPLTSTMAQTQTSSPSASLSLAPTSTSSTTSSPTTSTSFTATPSAPTSMPSPASPIATSLIPTYAPFHSTVAASNLHFVLRYMDKSWSSFYSSQMNAASDYTDMIESALASSFQLEYAHSLLYLQDDDWESKTWTRAGVTRIDFCRFSDVILNDDCSLNALYEANDDKEYVASAQLNVVADQEVIEYVRYLKQAMSSNTFYDVFNEQMNDLLNGIRRRNLLTNNFEVISIQIIDPVNDIFTTESVDESNDLSTSIARFIGTTTTTMYIIISVSVIGMCTILLVLCVCCSKKRRKKLKGEMVASIDDVEMTSADPSDDDMNTKKGGALLSELQTNATFKRQAVECDDEADDNDDAASDKSKEIVTPSDGHTDTNLKLKTQAVERDDEAASKKTTEIVTPQDTHADTNKNNSGGESVGSDDDVIVDMETPGGCSDDDDENVPPAPLPPSGYGYDDEIEKQDTGLLEAEIAAIQKEALMDDHM